MMHTTVARATEARAGCRFYPDVMFRGVRCCRMLSTGSIDLAEGPEQILLQKARISQKRHGRLSNGKLPPTFRMRNLTCMAVAMISSQVDIGWRVLMQSWPVTQQYWATRSSKGAVNLNNVTTPARCVRAAQAAKNAQQTPKIQNTLANRYTLRS